jgi:glucans biosynthesis protein C
VAWSVSVSRWQFFQITDRVALPEIIAFRQLRGRKIMKERRYDIDWLRVLVMVSVFFFHCARFFGGGTWHLNNAKESIVALLFIGWLDMWFMPLFFVLSGVGARYALESRTNGQYLWERIKRLLVPLYTVGLFILLPPQFYFEQFSNAGFTGTFLENLSLYFHRVGHFHIISPEGLLPLPFDGHLWFLKDLFMISLLALPLLRYLQSKRGLSFIDKVPAWCAHRGGVFLCLIPVILIRLALRSIFWGEHTWADFFELTVFFLIGYILQANTHFAENIKKYGWICLLFGIACFGGEGIFVRGMGYNYPGGEQFSSTFVLFEIVMSIGRWSWIVFVLSLGAKYLNFNNKALSYGNEAVLPFYIFHQTIILCVGWVVIPLNMGILPKFLIIAVTSFTLIMVLYELLVRRFNVVRFCFGMRPIKKSSQTLAPSPEGSTV